MTDSSRVEVRSHGHGRGGCSLGKSQHEGLDAGLLTGRAPHERVRAELSCQNAVFLFIEGRTHQNDGNVCEFANLTKSSAEIEAIDAVHHHVRDDGVGYESSLQHGLGGVGAFSRMNYESSVLELNSRKLELDGIIVHEKDPTSESWCWQFFDVIHFVPPSCAATNVAKLSVSTGLAT